jgi:hypothetical protein
MKNLLISQCLQVDFVQSLAQGEPLPNPLHIGREESKRLLGIDPSDGALTKFMRWAAATPDLTRIHIRDWHDVDAVDQQAHLRQFGLHCIANTPGADFVFEPAPDDLLVNSTTLNDFEKTSLAPILNGIIANEPCRIGLIGVWTEAKILFLAYELSTRYPQAKIAVSSALCASSSRAQHFLALEQLQRIVGVCVIDSLAEFANFLGHEASFVQAKTFNQTLSIEVKGVLDLSPEAEMLLRYLFRDCKKLMLTILDGGFSGNLVAAAKSIDHLGREQAPHVIKIGQRQLMAKERTAFEKVEAVLGNHAPAIAEYADMETLGAIKYRYAAMGDGKTKTLQHLLQSGTSLEKIEHYLQQLLDIQLGRFYRAALTESCDLLDYYCFSPRWAESVKHKIIELIGECPEQGDLRLPGGLSCKNLHHFYCHDLPRIQQWQGDFPFCYVHGDLNWANIMIDGHDNVWLIDFFHTHHGHLLKDFAKLENDLLYIGTEINNEADFIQACAFSDWLLSVSDDLQPELPAANWNEQFQRCSSIVFFLRKKMLQYLPADAENIRLQWQLAQLRYAVHTIGFDEPNHLQRCWALYTASCLAEKVKLALMVLSQRS